MTRMLTRTLSVTLLASTLSSAGAAEIKGVRVTYNGSSERPTALKEGDQVTAEVTVKGKNEHVFVGATVVDPTGEELDMRPQEIFFGEGMLGGSESKVTQLSVPLTSAMEVDMGSADPLRLVVRLWQNFVLADECTRTGADGERPCRFCRTNGCHMENPIGDANWQSLPPYAVNWRSGW